jgi:hypothetical protein
VKTARDRFRRRASYCVLLAQEARAPMRRQLLEIANAWLRLAEQAEDWNRIREEHRRSRDPRQQTLSPSRLLSFPQGPIRQSVMAAEWVLNTRYRHIHGG